MAIDQVDGMVFPETDDFHELAAFYSGYAFYESYRKIVLASCKEVIRAKYLMANQKITQDRIDDLAHLHLAYLDFIARHLVGRKAYERAFLAQGGMR